MKKFDFRLQKVLEYRGMLEQWAKDAYLEARSNRLESELKIIEINERRKSALITEVTSVDARRALESLLKQLDECELEQRVVVNVLLHEEEQCLSDWTERRIELESLQKMYDRQYAEWQQQEGRKLQYELDEWALRRKAA